MHPNQLRTNGVIVNDVPVHLAPDPSKATHSIYIVKDDLVILLTHPLQDDLAQEKLRFLSSSPSQAMKNGFQIVTYS
jgi:hypothetical protein